MLYEVITALRLLIWALYPFVKLTELLTRSLTEGPTLRGVNRMELMALAEFSGREGALAAEESAIVQNLLRLRETPARAAMTPRTVVFSRITSYNVCYTKLLRASWRTATVCG